MSATPAPWLAAPALPAERYAHVRRRAIFDCCKWDPQVEDVTTLAALPIVLPGACWRELAVLASSLAAETLAMERELLERPELHRALALPRPIRRALASPNRADPGCGAPRLIRFDFHHTSDGWRISEANTDVPGGINEASGFATLMAAEYPGTRTAGDAAGAYAAALVDAARRAMPNAAAGAPVIALVHATAYIDDQQVMTYLGRRIEACGGRAVLAAPSHVSWREGRTCVRFSPDGRLESTRADLIVRFFPAEWLARLPYGSGWRMFFAGARTPQSNPGTALLTQSKRMPLVWDALDTPVPTWRALLPATVEPRAVRLGDDGWVVKPALGRVGEGVGIPGVTPAREWRRIARDVRFHARHWVAQRRFTPTSFDTPDGPRYPCIGVYTVDARVVGAYGRLARTPLIDWRAQDAAVLVAAEPAAVTVPAGAPAAALRGAPAGVAADRGGHVGVGRHRPIDRRRTG